MSNEPRNEQAVCAAVMALLEQRLEEPLAVTARPDTVERQRPAVELLCESSTRRFAIEHTRIESFPTQIADGAIFSSLLEPLESELAGVLPGHFWLVVAVGATASVRTDQQTGIRERIKQWILTNAPPLEEQAKHQPRRERLLKARIDGVPFEVTLQRTGLSGSVLRLLRYVPDDLEVKRVERIRTALAKKCPKLAAQKADGRETVLVFESNDIALGNASAIADALRVALSERVDAPDFIFLVETETLGWYAFVLKEGSRLYPDVEGAGPVALA